MERYYNIVLRRRFEAMVDRITLAQDEGYEFQTDGNHYVIVINVSPSARIEVRKGDFLLATLGYLENYSCPSNTGPYVVRNISNTRANIILVRYILL